MPRLTGRAMAGGGPGNPVESWGSGQGSRCTGPKAGWTVAISINITTELKGEGAHYLSPLQPPGSNSPPNPEEDTGCCLPEPETPG